MVDLDFEHFVTVDAAQTIAESLALLPAKRRAFVNNDSLRQFHSGVKKQLSDSFANTSRIVSRHEGIAAPKDWIFDLAQSILKALTQSTVDVTASKNNMSAPVRIGIDAKAKTNKSCIIGKVFE